MLYLKDKYVILLDKKYYNDSYYKKNEINEKILELTIKLNEILLILDTTVNNTISNSELSNFILKMNLLKHEINELKRYLNPITDSLTLTAFKANSTIKMVAVGEPIISRFTI